MTRARGRIYSHPCIQIQRIGSALENHFLHKCLYEIFSAGEKRIIVPWSPKVERVTRLIFCLPTYLPSSFSSSQSPDLYYRTSTVGRSLESFPRVSQQSTSEHRTSTSPKSHSKLIFTMTWHSLLSENQKHHGTGCLSPHCPLSSSCYVPLSNSKFYLALLQTSDLVQ